MSIDIRLTENYKLTTDSRCWRIEQKRMTKGEEEWSPLSYHSGPTQALKYAESRLVRDSNATTFAELLEAANNAAQLMRIPVDEAIKQFKGLQD